MASQVCKSACSSREVLSIDGVPVNFSNLCDPSTAIEKMMTGSSCLLECRYLHCNDYELSSGGHRAAPHQNVRACPADPPFEILRRLIRVMSQRSQMRRMHVPGRIKRENRRTRVPRICKCECVGKIEGLCIHITDQLTIFFPELDHVDARHGACALLFRLRSPPPSS